MTVSDDIAVFILTLNEEIHVEKSINSAKEITPNIYVIDSGSNDGTEEICKKNNVKFIYNKWSGYSDQVNFAINLLKEKYKWLIRLDADEFLNDDIINWIAKKGYVGSDGVYFKRNIIFEGKLLSFGGVSDRHALRMFLSKNGYCENRLNDEHILVDGKVVVASGRMFDENKMGFVFFFNKHCKYAQLESQNFTVENNKSTTHRNHKNSYYDRVPLSFRCFLYFLYRYVFLLGFLDGVKGLKFHFWQCLVYRLLVDEYIKEQKHDNKRDVKKN
jgi:glycosyltransferase involved in cell wall biosynthesis